MNAARVHTGYMTTLTESGEWAVCRTYRDGHTEIVGTFADEESAVDFAGDRLAADEARAASAQQRQDDHAADWFNRRHRFSEELASYEDDFREAIDSPDMRPVVSEDDGFEEFGISIRRNGEFRGYFAFPSAKQAIRAARRLLARV